MLWDLPSITQLYMLCCESGVLEVSLLWLREILHSQNPDMGAVWCVRPRTLCRVHRSTGRWFRELGNSPVRHERLVISFCLASLVLSCCTLLYFYFKMLPLEWTFEYFHDTQFYCCFTLPPDHYLHREKKLVLTSGLSRKSLKVLQFNLFKNCFGNLCFFLVWPHYLSN